MASVVATALSNEHRFTKQVLLSITLIPNIGIEGDCHAGESVQHRSRLQIKPRPMNLRQVHLIQNEILLEHDLKPAEIGENVTTIGIDLLSLSKGTKLHFVPPEASDEIMLAQEHPVVTVNGLRNPCPQIEKHRKGLQEQFIERDAERKIVVRKAGVMSTVDTGGTVKPGMRIVVETPSDFKALECV